MKFYDGSKPLHIETDEFGVSLGVALLQTRIGTCPKYEVPGNSILRPITVSSKSLSSAEKIQ